MTVGPGGKILAAGNRLHDAATGRLLRTLRDNLEVAAFSPDGKRLAATVSHGPRDAAAILDVETGETLVTLKVLDDVNWIAVTPDGHFAGTPDARRTVSWRANGEVFPLELYVDVFFRPDIVSAAFLGNRRPERFPTGTPPVPAGDILALLADSVPVRLRHPGAGGPRPQCASTWTGATSPSSGHAGRARDTRRRRGVHRGSPSRPENRPPSSPRSPPTRTTSVPPWIVSRQARAAAGRTPPLPPRGRRLRLQAARTNVLHACGRGGPGRTLRDTERTGVLPRKTTLLTDRAATAGDPRARGPSDGCGPADVARARLRPRRARRRGALYYVYGPTSPTSRDACAGTIWSAV